MADIEKFVRGWLAFECLQAIGGGVQTILRREVFFPFVIFADGSSQSHQSCALVYTFVVNCLQNLIVKATLLYQLDRHSHSTGTLMVVNLLFTGISTLGTTFFVARLQLIKSDVQFTSVAIPIFLNVLSLVLMIYYYWLRQRLADEEAAEAKRKGPRKLIAKHYMEHQFNGLAPPNNAKLHPQNLVAKKKQ